MRRTGTRIMAIGLVSLALALVPSRDSPAATCHCDIIYFAEGTTRSGFDTLLTLYGGVRASYRVEFMFDDATSFALEYQLERQLLTIRPREIPEIGPDRDFGIIVMGPPSTGGSTGASRVTVFSAEMGLGAAIAGAVGSAPTLQHNPLGDVLFAEGSTLPGFREFITVLNPSEQTANLVVAYTFESGPGPTRTHSVPPRSRYTIDVNREDEAGPGHAGVSARVRSSVPVAAERLMYFRRDVGTGQVIDGATTSEGSIPVNRVTNSSPETSFPEGSVLPGFADFLLLFNPASEPITASIQWALENQVGRAVSVTVNPNTRITIRTATSEYGPGPVTSGSGAVGARVLGPVISERVTYVHRTINGLNVDDAHAGSAAGATRLCLPFEVPAIDAPAYLTVMGTDPEPYDLKVSFAPGITTTVPVSYGIRKTIDVSSAVKDKPASVVVSDSRHGPSSAAAAALVVYPRTGQGLDAGSAVIGSSPCLAH